ncbi:MAG: YcaQ family DNA glycosylase [Anaerolineales bacterium]|nr:YcaQ family DNA glycosylase [Anaerolineales bacterium]
MATMIRPISLALARRLAITRQRLAGPRPAPGPAGLLEVARDLGCIQLDPINAVDRTHRLVCYSRAGHFDGGQLDQLVYGDRQLFEYWAHCASLVLTEDYPLHHLMMRRYPGGDSAWSERTRQWIKDNAKLRRFLLAEIRKHGPLPSRLLVEEGLDPQAWVSSGWTSGRNVSRMLDFLWIQGKIMVAGRAGGQKLWDLAERVLPEWTPRQRLGERAAVRRAAEKAVRALGVASPRDINHHFTRDRYPGLPRALADLEKQGRLVRVAVTPESSGAPWKGPHYAHADDLPALERLANGDWQPRTVLLSPFDNLICDRQRTQQWFDFDFRIEIYVPKHKRKYGYYVLPILHGDRLIGRVDPLMDRARSRLIVNAVYAEPTAPSDRATANAVAGAVEDLARFLGARDIGYDRRRVPAAWKAALS